MLTGGLAIIYAALVSLAVSELEFATGGFFHSFYAVQFNASAVPDELWVPDRGFYREPVVELYISDVNTNELSDWLVKDWTSAFNVSGVVIPGSQGRWVTLPLSRNHSDCQHYTRAQMLARPGMNVREYEMDDEWAYGGYRCNLTAANAGNALLENLVNSPGNDPVVVGLGIRTHVDNTSDAWMRWDNSSIHGEHDGIRNATIALRVVDRASGTNATQWTLGYRDSRHNEPTYEASHEALLLYRQMNCPTGFGPTEAIAQFGAMVPVDQYPTARAPSHTVSCNVSTVSFEVGRTPVKCELALADGTYVDTCEYSIEVVDTVAPSLLVCPPRQEVVAEAGLGAADNFTLTWSPPVFYDRVTTVNLSVVSNYASGDRFSLGKYDVLFTATDDSGNQEVCAFSIALKGYMTTECEIYYTLESFVADAYLLYPDAMREALGFSPKPGRNSSTMQLGVVSNSIINVKINSVIFSAQEEVDARTRALNGSFLPEQLEKALEKAGVPMWRGKVRRCMVSQRYGAEVGKKSIYEDETGSFLGSANWCKGEGNDTGCPNCLNGVLEKKCVDYNTERFDVERIRVDPGYTSQAGGSTVSFTGPQLHTAMDVAVRDVVVDFTAEKGNYTVEGVKEEGVGGTARGLSVRKPSTWGYVTLQTPAKNYSGYQPITFVVDKYSEGIYSEAVVVDLLFYANFSDCLEPGQWKREFQTCEGCEEGAYCPGGGRQRPLAGYWAETEFHRVVLCAAVLACPGTEDRVTTKCAEGYQGVGCSVCGEGYYRDFQLCLSCGDGDSAGADAAVRMLVAWLAFFVSMSLIAYFSPSKLIIFTEVVVFVQQLVGITTYAIQEFPEQVLWISQINSYVSILNWNMDAVKPGCGVAALSLLGMFWLTLVIMVLGMGLLVLLQQLSVKLKKWDIRENIQRNKVAMLLYVKLVYLRLLQLAMMMLRCNQHGSIKSLNYDKTVMCYSDEHLPVSAFSAFLIFTLMFAYPVLMFVMYRNAAKKVIAFHELHAAEQEDLKSQPFDPIVFFLQSYHPQRYWMALGQIFISFVVASMAVASDYAETRVGVCCIAMCLYTVGIVFSRPFRTRMYLFKTVLLNFLFMLLGLGLLAMLGAVGTRETGPANFISYSILFSLTCAVLVAVLLRHFFRRTASDKWFGFFSDSAATGKHHNTWHAEDEHFENDNDPIRYYMTNPHFTPDLGYSTNLFLRLQYSAAEEPAQRQGETVGLRSSIELVPLRVHDDADARKSVNVSVSVSVGEGDSDASVGVEEHKGGGGGLLELHTDRDSGNARASPERSSRESSASREGSLALPRI